MKREVKAGVGFIKRMAVACGKVDESKAELFAQMLQKLLCDKYENHWYPNSPSKGQAYRYQCIRINNGTLCEVVLKACEESELTPRELGLPPEFTLWIDPLEVCRPGLINRHVSAWRRHHHNGSQDPEEARGE
uniref:Si:dkey-79d12.5 n=1 Tax=Takifugu rubripes TaxID=31033 RepID=A0A674MH38_TAKRU